MIKNKFIRVLLLFVLALAAASLIAPIPSTIKRQYQKGREQIIQEYQYDNKYNYPVPHYICMKRTWEDFTKHTMCNFKHLLNGYFSDVFVGIGASLFPPTGWLIIWYSPLATITYIVTGITVGIIYYWFFLKDQKKLVAKILLVALLYWTLTLAPLLLSLK